VRQRAGNTCEYCGLPQEASFHTFHVEHVTPRQHRGSDDAGNLALACNRCNSQKGPNLSSIDPDTGAVVELFNPREDVWVEHFDMRSGEVIGLTPCGRASVLLFEINEPERVAMRLQWAQRADDD
jgi:hypothetical protein